MKSTIADIRQLFYTNKVVAATKVEDLKEGELGIFPEDSDTSIAASIVYDTLPDKIRIISRANGKLLFSMDPIPKNAIRDIAFQAKREETPNIWSTVLEGSDCDCIESVLLNININNAALMSQDGLTWGHRDVVHEVAPKELTAICECDGVVTEGVNIYQNHLMTAKLYETVMANKSPYYEAEVQDADENVLEDLEAINTYIADNKDANLGDDPDAFTGKLTFILKSKVEEVEYDDIDVNYVGNRGTTIVPSLTVSGIPVVFEEVQELEVELGAGADLRLQEWENMNFYTDLNFAPQLSDSIKHKKVKYQFKNGVTYDALTFEYGTAKVERNTGETKLFGVLIASDDSTAVTRLKAIFGIS